MKNYKNNILIALCNLQLTTITFGQTYKKNIMEIMMDRRGKPIHPRLNQPRCLSSPFGLWGRKLGIFCKIDGCTKNVTQCRFKYNLQE